MSVRDAGQGGADEDGLFLVPVRTPPGQLRREPGGRRADGQSDPQSPLPRLPRVGAQGAVGDQDDVLGPAEAQQLALVEVWVTLHLRSAEQSRRVGLWGSKAQSPKSARRCMALLSGALGGWGGKGEGRGGRGRPGRARCRAHLVADGLVLEPGLVQDQLQLPAVEVGHPDGPGETRLLARLHGLRRRWL